MPRFFLPPEAWDEAPALTGDEARHLSQVLRLKAGAEVTVFDGRGRRAAATVRATSRDRVVLELGEIFKIPARAVQIGLAQAIPKGKNMDFIVQKAVELGVASIQPLVTRNTVVQPGEGKSEKWRRTALEACKQCGQDTLPSIAEPLAFGAWITDPAAMPGLKLVAALSPGARPLREVLREGPAPESVLFLVGPEGDFSPAETVLALEAGFIPVSLGSIVLRAETAALFGLSAVNYEFA